ncbi:MAG: asparaginase [Burkholderiaceae bacterium]|jgi:L-asparaginase|nr:asparaginase [Burkholderiaceae bacterium]
MSEGVALHVVATGGTFDKRYNAIEGVLDFGESHVAAMLNRARVDLRSVTLEVLPLMDSLDMRDADRQRIVSACSRARGSAILIIHGTDTMQETAAALASAVPGKTIVLTGAMVPYEVAESDALFNLGFAFGAAKWLVPNVYIAMNGRVFSWDNVRKNRLVGRFEPKK